MTAALRPRPTVEAFSLDQLMEWAWTGRLRIPRFQRPLKWTGRDVVMLYDSIVSGYPIGSLLLWEREAPAETVRLGPLTIDAPQGPALYVVDGQQRLTSLAASLHPDGASDATFRIGYDLTNREFVSGRPVVDDAVVPVDVLYEGSRLLAWFRDRPHLMDDFEAASVVSKALGEFRVPAYVVRQDDEETLRTIFDRMNNAGKRLTRAEVFGALHRPQVGDRDLTPSWLAERLQESTGFGLVDQGIGMQLLLARRGSDVNREIRNEFSRRARGRDDWAKDETEADAYERGSETAIRAVTFLQNDGGVPHLAFLPYQHLLIALARLVGQHDIVHPRRRRLLRRAFWRAAVAGPLLGRGDTSGAARVLTTAIDPATPSESLRRLLDVASLRPPPRYPDADPFRTNTAATKMLLCALWDAGAPSPTTGERVTAPELRAALGDATTALEVTPLLVASGRLDDAPAQAGNRVLLVAPHDREEPPLALLRRASDDVVESHLLSREDLDVLDSRDGASGAVTRRTERMTRVLHAFLDRMCEWEQEDTPDLDSLVSDSDDTDDLGDEDAGTAAHAPA